jgi:hypothetical protein
LTSAIWGKNVKGNKKGKEELSNKVEGEGKIINHGMR